jgi:quaternary ammonium compound-resistance protein SugE
MDIKEIINQRYAMPDASLDRLQQCLTEVSYPKGFRVLKCGKVEKDIFFIKQGIVRAYTSVDGKARAASGVGFYLWGSGFLASTILSMTLLAKAVQTLPLGTAYAIWTGIGAVGTVLIGIFVFKEPATPIRLFFLFALIASLIGLKVVSY